MNLRNLFFLILLVPQICSAQTLVEGAPPQEAEACLPVRADMPLSQLASEVPEGVYLDFKDGWLVPNAVSLTFPIPKVDRLFNRVTRRESFRILGRQIWSRETTQCEAVEDGSVTVHNVDSKEMLLDTDIALDRTYPVLIREVQVSYRRGRGGYRAVRLNTYHTDTVDERQGATGLRIFRPSGLPDEVSEQQMAGVALVSDTFRSPSLNNDYSFDCRLDELRRFCTVAHLSQALDAQVCRYTPERFRNSALRGRHARGLRTYRR